MSDDQENGRMLMEVGAVFHEQQRLLLCGVHCLNALFCNQIPAHRGAAGMPPLYSKVHETSVQRCVHGLLAVGGYALRR